MSLVLQAVRRHAADRPHQLALTDGDVSLNYAALHAEILRLTDLLRPIVEGGRPVALILDNGPAWAVLDLVLLGLRTPVVPIPPFFTGEMVAHTLTDAGAGLRLRAAAPGESAVDAAGARIVVEVVATPRALLHPGTAKVTYTSGSTGRPKGVCLSAAHMEATAAAVVEALGPDLAGVHLPVLPLGVLLENVAGLYANLLAGGAYHARGLASLGFADPFRPDFARLAGAAVDAEATSLILTPELLRGLMGAMVAGGVSLPRLTFVAVGGARVSPDLLLRARALGLPAFEGYGLSECASVVTLNTPVADRPGTAGRALSHVSLASEDGELVVSGDGFLGYAGEPAHSGPVRTGDLGSIDADGFVTISGRRANTLITSYGRNVSPEWVESELLAQPEIAQAVVFGEGCARPEALLSPTAAGADPARLQAAVARANARLPAYAQVGRWVVTGPLDAAAGELTRNGRPRRDVVWARRGHLLKTTEPA